MVDIPTYYAIDVYCSEMDLCFIHTKSLCFLMLEKIKLYMHDLNANI